MSAQTLPQDANAVETVELKLIRDYYGTRTAERSGVPLIQHILEGLEILVGMKATEVAKKAYCLHPLLQHDDDLAKNWQRVSDMPEVSRQAFNLAMVYRTKANSYLCREHTDHFTLVDIERVVGFCSQNMIHMLVADKIQNEKDFELYHKGTHARSDQLANYFDLWLQYLDFCEAKL